MSNLDNAVIIGLTGSFGSGCTTISEILENNFGFERFSLSGKVKEEAKRRGFDVEKNDKDLRGILQDIGNELREKHGNNFLASETLNKAEKDATGERIVFDSIRNTGEIQEFRKLPNFFLMTVDCDVETRWERLLENDTYTPGDRELFDKHDLRDRDERLPQGQQIRSCVEQADIIFLNQKNYPTNFRITDEISNRLERYVDLVTGDKILNPTLDETIMTVASNMALQSPCLKRRVGAALCNEEGYIVSAAYNKVPGKGKSCLEEYRMCYRDRCREKFKSKLLGRFACPKCENSIETMPQPPDFECPKCNEKLNDYIPRFKALDKCRSLHAEEAVILGIPISQINGGTLYSTTFPCLQCAKRIIHVGLRKIIYIEPYPESEAVEEFERNKIIAKKFEGVKAQVYYRLYYKQREILEKKLEKRRKGG